jgi:nucleoside-diphosphate-sugar epimerase
VRIAVTGASGFVGGAIATALADRDHSVTGFGRTPNGWSHPMARYRQWDVTTGPLIGDRDFDVVVHAAALADDWAPLPTAMRVNRDGSRAVVRSFPGARFVHISTSSVYDAFTPSTHAKEAEAPARRFLSAYSESKSAAELEFAGTDAAILRPHAVYGPGDTTLLPRVVAGIRGGRLLLPEGAEVAHMLTHIRNLVHAVSLAAAPGAARGVFNIGDDSDVLLSAVITEFLARRGLGDTRIVGIPYQTAFALAGSIEAAHRLTRRGRPRLTRYAVSQVGLERTLDITAARESLGYDPYPTTLAGAETW